MHLTSADRVPPDLVAQHRRTTWVVSSTHGGSDAGLVGITELDAGYDEQLGGLSAIEQVIVVLTGHPTLVSDDREQPLSPRTAVFVPNGSAFGLRSSAPVTLLHVYGGVSSPELLATETHSANEAGGDAIHVIPLQDVEGVPMNDPAMGMFNIVSRMLVMSEILGNNRVLVGHAQFEPGRGVNEVHRHPSAGEFIYLLAGSGSQLDENGKETPVRAGDVVYAPPGEWHGFRNTGEIPAETIFGFLGLGSFEKIGYELKG
jgi:uncharacterized cupin superfamily protein